MKKETAERPKTAAQKLKELEGQYKFAQSIIKGLTKLVADKNDEIRRIKSEKRICACGEGRGNGGC